MEVMVGMKTTRMHLVARSLVVLAALALPAQLIANPRIVAPDPVLEFGSMTEAETLKHAFKIENRGTEPLRITRVRACCGATARARQTEIPPDGSTELDITYSLRGRRGTQRKRIFVASNDPSTPHLQLILQGVVTAAKPVAAEAAEGLNPTPSPDDEDPSPEPDPGPEASLPPVIVDYFHEPGCPACRRIEQHVIPVMQSRFGDYITFNKWDLNSISNVVRLIAYQDALAIEQDEPVLIVLDQRTVLNGVRAIEGNLLDAIEEAIESRRTGSYQPATAISIPDIQTGTRMAEERSRTFTMATILVAGLIDGLNPCAMTALAFLMSLLAVSKVTGRKMLMLGIPYCLAAFLTYLAIGLGLMRAIHMFYGVPLLRLLVELALTGAVLVVAFLSFRDAWRFSRSGASSAVALKLPKGITKISHAIMRRGVKGKYLAVGGFMAGAAVTVLDSVCTGQLYVPTLALMIQFAEGEASRRAWTYLVAYNVMFIVPLTTVFFLMWAGLRNEALLTWSRRHVVTGKVLMGTLMLVIAAILVTVMLQR